MPPMAVGCSLVDAAVDMSNVVVLSCRPMWGRPAVAGNLDVGWHSCCHHTAWRWVTMTDCGAVIACGRQMSAFVPKDDATVWFPAVALTTSCSGWLHYFNELSDHVGCVLSRTIMHSTMLLPCALYWVLRSNGAQLHATVCNGSDAKKPLMSTSMGNHPWLMAAASAVHFAHLKTSDSNISGSQQSMKHQFSCKHQTSNKQIPQSCKTVVCVCVCSLF